MVRRKGLAYTIEVMLALVVVFLFLLGNPTPEIDHDWTSFQDEVAAQDLGHTLKQTGDMDRFIQDRNTGSLRTATEVVSSGRLEGSGTVEGLPLEETDVGLTVRNNERDSEPLKDLEDYNECGEEDLQEIETDDPIYVTERDDKPKLYLANTTLSSDYDSLYVDNQTDCQLTSDQGPFIENEIFNWKNHSSDDFREFKETLVSAEEVVLHQADRAVNLREQMDERVTSLETAQTFTTVWMDAEDLSEYDIILFNGYESLNQIENNRDEVERFMADNPVILMMNLEMDDFDDGFIRDTGLEWIELSYSSDISGDLEFTDDSQEVETYFEGISGSVDQIEMGTGGNISSSPQGTLLEENKFIEDGSGLYDNTEWDAENDEMSQIDPAEVDNLPESECVEDGTEDENLTIGEFLIPSYPDQQNFENYDFINIRLGSDDQICEEREIRALAEVEDTATGYEVVSDLYLNREEIQRENKLYRVNFPDEEALQEGDHAQLLHDGSPQVEAVNMRRSSPEMELERLIRMPYRDEYNEDEYKLLTSLIYFSTAENVKYGSEEPTDVSSKVISGFDGQTYLPYGVSFRWY